MSKYNKGDRFIVEVKEVMESKNGTLYRGNFSTLTFDDYGLDKLEKYNEIKEKLELIDELKQAEYNRGLQDAWKIAGKMCDYAYQSKTQIIFGESKLGNAIRNHTPQEALAKLESNEEEQIKVGDVVECRHDKSVTVVVTSLSDDDTFNGINAKGRSFSGRYVRDWKRTGKHIDIASILAEIGKE